MTGTILQFIFVTRESSLVTSLGKTLKALTKGNMQRGPKGKSDEPL